MKNIYIRSLISLLKLMKDELEYLIVAIPRIEDSDRWCKSRESRAHDAHSKIKRLMNDLRDEERMAELLLGGLEIEDEIQEDN
jgi:hypothetical protein